MSQLSHERFPRGALLGAAALLTVAIGLAATARVTGVGTLSNPTTAPVESRSLRFEDRPDGGIAVYEAGREARPVEVYEPGGGHGFVRGVLRGLARERKLRGIGREPAFRLTLTRWADGRLSLEDPVTGRRIELDAFGPTNAGSFAELLVAGRTP